MFIIGGITDKTGDLDNETSFSELLNEDNYPDYLSVIEGPSLYQLKYGSDNLQRDACIIPMPLRSSFAITGGSLNVK